jgi:hypothetical protein
MGKKANGGYAPSVCGKSKKKLILSLPKDLPPKTLLPPNLYKFYCP